MEPETPPTIIEGSTKQESVENAPAPIDTATATSVQAGSQPSNGLNGPFPTELNHWNWGAFFLTWIWSVGNKTWIGLLALFGPLAFIMAIVLGIKGNEWAWQNRKFESVEQFKNVQRTWARIGLILFVIPIVGILLAMVLVSMNAARQAAV